MQPTISR